MALRTFEDRNGERWNVWSVTPGARTVAATALAYRNGWLCFSRASGGMRYRLPLDEVSAEWESLPDDRLDLLRRVAAVSRPDSADSSCDAPDAGPSDDL